jgi:hypothetical protein
MARGLYACAIRLDDAGGRLRYRVPGHKHRIKDHAGKRERFTKATQSRVPSDHE